jgi:predicted transcriptional regulator
MKSSKRLPKDYTSVRILTLAKSGETKKKLAEAVSMSEPQFRRYMAAIVDRGLLRFDAQKRMWVTTEKGYAFLEGTQLQDHGLNRA